MSKELFGGKRHILTDEDRKKAGDSTREYHKQRGEIKEYITEWLCSEVGKDKNGNPMTGAQTMVAKAVQEMMKGNPKFWELLRDTAGQKPIDKVMIAEVEQSVIDEVERMVLGDDEATGS